MKTYFVVSAVGEDRPGFVNRVAREIGETGGHIELQRAGQPRGEVLVMTDSLRELVLKRADAGMIAKAAAAEGMASMFDDGLRKALAGDTSLDEVLRVTQDSHQ